MGVYLS